VTRPRLPFLAAGGAVILAGALGVALLLTNTGAACAAPPPTTAQNGKATFYDLGPGGTGNCSFPKSPADGLFVALGPDQYAKGAACGMYLDVTGPKGKVRVKVTDQCPECATGHLDLSRTAFRAIGAEASGIIPITYKTVVNPAVPGPMTVTIKNGSSQWWLAVLIDNHGNQLKSVTVNGKVTHREDYNYWIVDGGAGPGPFSIKVTNVQGWSATLSNIKLAAGTTQTTPVRFPGTATVKKAAPAKKAPAVAKKAPKPEATTAGPVVAVATDEPTSAAAIAAADAQPPAGPDVDLAAAARCG
jgi:expansin